MNRVKSSPNSRQPSRLGFGLSFAAMALLCAPVAILAQTSLTQGSQSTQTQTDLTQTSMAQKTQTQKKRKFFPGKAYVEGQVIEVTGTVTDPAGRAIPDLEVQLEGSRRHFKVRSFKRENDHPRVVTARTDQNGRYVVRWKWHEYYNNFALRAVVPVKRVGGLEKPEVLIEDNLSTRILNGSPVAASLMIEDPTFLNKMRGFLASLDSNDEQRIYNEMGKPDRVETLKFPDREEVSWWYFTQGRTYRFVDGEIEQAVDFDPVDGS